jgi:outer membrane protein assembly factor BamB
VRRKLGTPGAIVSAVAMQEPNAFWETRVASPLAGEPLVLGAGGKNDGKVVAVTANGGAFRIDANQSGFAVVNDPITASDSFRIPQPISRVVRLAGGLLAVSGGKGGEHVGVFDPTSDAPLMRWLKVPGVLACAPASLGRGLLAPCKSGQVFWLDPDPNKSGGDLQLAEPFQPRIEPGVDVDWMNPVIVNDTQAVIADGKMSVYLVGVQDQPKPHLAGLAQAALAKPLGAPPAILGQTVFAADTAGGLGVLTMPALAHGNETALGGRCAWGPDRVGDSVLVSTDDGQLLCFDSKGTRMWRVSLEHGPLAGAPLRVGSQLLVASRNGIVWRAEAATGKELATVDTGYPLATGPVLCGQKLLVGGHDGTLYEVRQP